MATEHDVLMRKVTPEGTAQFFYPTTYVRNILDLDDYGIFAVADTMHASGWEDGVYSFEGSYPSNQYDLTIEIDGDRCTDDEFEAWNDAQIIGSATTNSCRSFGYYPDIDIPIIIKAVMKI